MQILYLAHRFPYPPNKGDKIRSYNQIRYLAARHVVDLVCLADDPRDMEHTAALQALCRTVDVIPLPVHRARLKGLFGLATGKSISQRYFHSRRMQTIVNARLRENRYAAVICFSSPMAEYLFFNRQLRINGNGTPQAAPGSDRPRLIMDFCDVDSDKWSQYSRNCQFPVNRLYGLEGRRLLAFDGRVNRSVDGSLFVSHAEANLFQDLLPGARNVHVVPNGVDHDYFHPGFGRRSPETGPSAPRLLFTGAMDYQPNVDGVLWFHREILPIIHATHPGVEMTIVGSNPRAEIRELDSELVTVTGFVHDIRPSYRTADVSIVPLRMARGVQNKVIEAMAMGKPVVSTSAAVQGLGPLTGDPLFVADTARDFAAGVCRILDNPGLAGEMSARGREFVVQRFDWERNMARLEELL